MAQSNILSENVARQVWHTAGRDSLLTAADDLSPDRVPSLRREWRCFGIEQIPGNKQQQAQSSRDKTCKPCLSSLAGF